VLLDREEIDVKRMCSELYDFLKLFPDLFKFWEITDIISETVLR